jgi:hypothetical protein
MKTLTLVLFLFLFVSGNCFAGDKTTKDSLRIVTIVNGKIFTIIDSILTHELACDYYESNMTFSINLDDRNKIILIGSKVSRVFKTDNMLGCFKYHDHLFIIYGVKLFKSLFQISNFKIPFDFAKSQTSFDNKAEVLTFDSDSIQDDSTSYWYYKYVGDDFFFLSHNCCENY